MKRFITQLSALILLITFNASAVTHTVFVGGNTFSTDPGFQSGIFFTPSNLLITQGDEVEFVLVAGFHNATGLTGPAPFSTGAPTSHSGTDETLNTLTFDLTGTYDFWCDIHQLSMTGVINVVPNVFINEIHYDNTSSDVNEGIELVGPTGTDLSCFDLEFYNGSNGTVYDVVQGAGFLADEGCGYGAQWLAQSGIQNGAPDGVALIYDPNLPGCTMTGTVAILQFLSYEGTFAATAGTASGFTSTDIGVSETSSTGEGLSLQLTGVGTQAGDFAWTGPDSASINSINVNQYFCDAPPSNNNCEQAWNISCGDTVNGTTEHAGIEDPGFCGTILNTAPGVWFVLNGNNNNIRLSTCNSSFDTKLGVFSGDCSGTLDCITGNDDDCSLQSIVEFPAMSGTDYYVLLTGFASNFGDYELVVECLGPLNDDCANAISIEDGTVAFSTVGAAGSDITSCTFGDFVAVWFEYTAVCDGIVNINTCDSATSYDTNLSIFDSCGGSELFCNDDDCGLQSQIDFEATSGVSYLIRISGFNGASGTGVLSISQECCDAPTNLSTTNIGRTSAELNWDCEPDAVSYVVRGNAVGVPGFVTLALPAGCQSPFPVGGLTGGVDYFWEVKKICNLSESEFSEPDTFTTTCGKPTPISTDNISATTATLNWTPVEGATSYKIKGRACGGAFVQLTVQGGTTSSYPVAGLTPSTCYEWRIRANCPPDGNSGYTALTSFTTPSSKFENSIANSGFNFEPYSDLVANIYPNPSTGNLNLNLSFDGEKEIKLELFDLIGREIISLQEFASDELNKQFDLNELPNGQYLFKISIGNKELFEKITLNR